MTGRPVTRAISANSSTKRSGPHADWMVPNPLVPSTPASEKISSRDAARLGTGSPWAPRWDSERDVEKPSAPACTDSHTSCVIAAMSAAVAGSRSAPRLPIANTRTAPCGTASRSRRRTRASRGSRVRGERLPLPRDPFAHRRQRDVLDPFHQRHEQLALLRAAGSEADAAVPHHDRGDALVGGRQQRVVPGHLRVVVRVDVDEAGASTNPSRSTTASAARSS